MANVVGMHNPRVVNGLEGSGRMSGIAVQHAAALIRTGQAEVVACVYGNNGRSVQMRYGGDTGDQMARSLRKRPVRIAATAVIGNLTNRWDGARPWRAPNANTRATQ
jgi:acetyl-CoA acetyltransferase